METVLILAQWLLPLLYLALVIDYGATFFMRTRTEVRERGLLVVIVLHTAFLVGLGVHRGYPPLFNAYEVLTLIALCTTVVYCIVERLGRDRRTGVFVFLMVFLLQYTASVFLVGARAPEAPAAGEQISRSVHSIVATLAYTALAVAAVHGALHLIGRRNLKRHNFGVLFDRLPPLELLGRICWYAVVGGLAFMTVSVATGVLVAGQAGGADGGPSPKVMAKIIMGLLTWVICAVAVGGKLLGKWQDSRISIVATGGAAAVAVLLVVSLILS